MNLLVTKWFGCVVLDGERIVARKDFPREAAAVADRLERIRRGEVLDEERSLAASGVAVAEPRLKSIGTLTSPPAVVVDNNGAPAALLHDAAMLVARDELRRAAGERDRFVVQAVRAFDEITRTANTLMERLRDWYALHFPEALRRITDQAKFAKILADSPDRAAVANALGELRPGDSIGADFTKDELVAMQDLARSIGALFAEHDRLERLIEADAREVSPTLSGLVGPIISARLISHANGLEDLASLPASTVQTLGAENALFMHLKEGKNPPKHGVLFQHPLVNTAPRWQRGRIARLMSGYAARAARIDWFAEVKGDRSADLKAGLERSLEALRRRAKPPIRDGRGPRPRPPHRAAPHAKGGRRG